MTGTMTEVFGFKVDFMNELGRGSFGTVYKGIDQNDSIVAVKKISTGTKEDRKKASTEAMKFHYLKDRLLQHNEHITRIDDVKYLHNAIWIIMEYCDLGDLNQFFKAYHHMWQDTEVKVKLMMQIINGIAFLHDRNIVHRDIKPGNILLKLMPNGCALVKLGDFGLSKILDPDSLTSAMSSNVGTLSFKAPEFWNTQPGDDGKVKYHRNVDVYAAGLTFAAMLQAQPARRLVPKPEGSLQTSETAMPIGLISHNRMVNNQPDISIVEDRDTESGLVKKVKKLIRGMTHTSPTDRLSASKVDKMIKEPLLTQCPSLNVDLFTDAICFANGHLVFRGRSDMTSGYTLKIYDCQRVSVREEWQTNCQHYLPYGLLSVCIMPGASRDEYLMEGCPHQRCRVIRSYDMKTGKATVVYENVEPHKMCTGPRNTLLVCDWKSKDLLQLVFTGDGLQAIHKLSLNLLPVQGMCYSANSGAVIISNVRNRQIDAIDLVSGHTVWQITEFADLVDWIELEPEDVCTTPNGWVCVANRTNVLVLDASNGNFVSTLDVVLDSLPLSDPNSALTSEAAGDNPTPMSDGISVPLPDPNNALTSEAAGDNPTQMSADTSVLVPSLAEAFLHTGTFNEATTTPWNNVPVPVMADAQPHASTFNQPITAIAQSNYVPCIHKVMWSDNALSQKTAVRYAEEKMSIYEVIFAPSESSVVVIRDRYC